MVTMDTAFRIERLNIFYGEKMALKEVNFNIPAKTVTAVIGPSGCGKSTFIRCLNRMNDLIPVFRIEGKIEYDGMDIYSKEVDVIDIRRQIGMVFQKPNPFPKSIYENVAYGLRIQGIKKKAVIDGVVEESLKKAALWEELKEDYTVVIVTHNMQQAARVSEYTGFFMLGEMVEFDNTQKIFTAPSNKMTEDYITGRFG